MPKLFKGEQTVKEKEKEERKEKQDELGVCRIRSKEGTLGSGAVVKDLFPFSYCLITSDKVFPKDDFNIKNYYLDFRKFKSNDLETFKLQDVAAMSTDIIRTDFGLVIIPIPPPEKCRCRKKETIFTYRPFDVASEKIELDKDDLRCHYVDHFDAKSFVVQSLKLKYVSGQYELHEDPDISYQTYAQVTNRKGYSKPHGAVILKHGCEEFTVAGVLTFTNDERKNISPVIFPLRHVIVKNPGDKSQEEQQKAGQRKSTDSLNKKDVDEEKFESLPDVDGPHQEGSKYSQAPNTDDGIVPPDPDVEVSGDGVAGSELPHSQKPNVADPSQADGVVLPGPNIEVSGDSFAGRESPHSHSKPNVAGPAQAIGVVPPDPNNEVSRDQGSVSGHELNHNQQTDTAAVPEGTTGVVVPHSASRNAQESLPAAAAQPTPQNGNNLDSLTGAPVQVEAEDMGSEGDETTQQKKAANSYDHLLVSDVVRKNKFLEDKLAGELDHTSHRVIKTWEHLSCTKEVDAPLETRIRCKLNSEFSCTEMLIDVLAEERGDKTVQDLIEALKAIKSNNYVVTIITSVYPENSTETISSFAASDNNSELIKKMATELDQKSRVVGYWKDLGQQFKISNEKLKEIQCGRFNPTLALMEYLYSKQEDLTVKTFYDKVETDLNLNKTNKVLQKLDPYLDEHGEELMKDVIEPESDVMRSICVCLNNPDRAPVKDWRHLANAFKVPRDIYKDFNPKTPRSPTALLLEWIYANKTDLTVGQLCAALQSIDRNDVVRDIRKHFKQPANGH